MNNARRIVRLAQLCENVGRDVYNKFGGYLRCKKCGHEEGLTSQLVIQHFKYGWPMCCDKTMIWYTGSEDNENTEKGPR